MSFSNTFAKLEHDYYAYDDTYWEPEPTDKEVELEEELESAMNEREEYMIKLGEAQDRMETAAIQIQIALSMLDDSLATAALENALTQLSQELL